MTNHQCYSYCVKAIANLKNNNIELTPDNLYMQLYYLWDIYTEEQIEKIVRREEIKHDLF